MKSTRSGWKSRRMCQINRSRWNWFDPHIRQSVFISCIYKPDLHGRGRQRWRSRQQQFAKVFSSAGCNVLKTIKALPPLVPVVVHLCNLYNEFATYRTLGVWALMRALMTRPKTISYSTRFKEFIKSNGPPAEIDERWARRVFQKKIV